MVQGVNYSGPCAMLGFAGLKDPFPQMLGELTE